MAKRVIILVVVLVVGIFAYVSYNRYDARRAGVSGEVFSNDPQLARAKMDSVSRAATESTGSSGGETIVYPPAATAQPVPAAAAAPASTPSALQVAQTGKPALETPPGGDTISPNPTNGMVFAGKGKYQVYRQGNITWRLNTETGQSCVLFATDEEWKKPRVYRAGCGSSR